MDVTIGQVAKRAGVSKATVSRVINKTKPVKDETRIKVLRTIKELDFKPNPAARSLGGIKDKNLGLIVNDISNLFVSTLVKGIEDTASVKGYNLSVSSSMGDVNKEIELLNKYSANRVDGVIFLTTALNDQHINYLENSSMPVAMVNVYNKIEGAVNIRVDNYMAAYEMTSYFLEKGYERVGMLRTYLLDQHSGRDRFVGYWQALASYGIAYKEELVKCGILDSVSGYHLAGELVRDCKDIQAIFVACDLMAFGAIRALDDLGLKVPGDVEVAGFDDVPLASYYIPSLTTVRQPITKMGGRVAECLVSRIEEGTSKCQEIILPYEIIYRESTNK